MVSAYVRPPPILRVLPAVVRLVSAGSGDSNTDVNVRNPERRREDGGRDAAPAMGGSDQPQMGGCLCYDTLSRAAALTGHFFRARWHRMGAGWMVTGERETVVRGGGGQGEWSVVSRSFVTCPRTMWGTAATSGLSNLTWSIDGTREVLVGLGRVANVLVSVPYFQRSGERRTRRICPEIWRNACVARFFPMSAWSTLKSFTTQLVTLRLATNGWVV